MTSRPPTALLFTTLAALTSPAQELLAPRPAAPALPRRRRPGDLWRPLAAALDAGRRRRQLARDRRTLQPLDERLLRVALPGIRIRKSPDIVLVNGVGIRGTTPIATRTRNRLDAHLRAIGIELDPEFAQIERELPVTTGHSRRSSPSTRRPFGGRPHL